MTILSETWQHGFLPTNHLRLHYVTQGEGELMLMLHGFPEFWYSWRHQIPEFAKDYKVVAIDLRGYNESDKPIALEAYTISEFILDVKGIIEALGYDRCTLVSHDWGGTIAWHFAYAYPQMLDKLIVLNLPHPAKFAEGLRTLPQLLRSWYIFLFQLPWLPEFLLQWNNCEAIGKAFSEVAIDKTAFSQIDLQNYREAAAKPGSLTAMLNYYRNVRSALPSKQWDVLEIPTLMIWGENDAALGKELTYGTEAYVRNLTLRYIPHCSHWVQQEQPQLVNQYMREFLSPSN
ncbi:alpha/beta hydrolase [Tumidithrix elongata RA019]|uniref:Alpha/beta hydrolase n=1 Tax=Tumidithrix elongata BACA0141 TaxID=2716417 RepID=A0AAW9Q212_9CYAN|nr:alpha/beta hydrolase [Tumidithrix elongata RA019]